MHPGAKFSYDVRTHDISRLHIVFLSDESFKVFSVQNKAFSVCGASNSLHVGTENKNMI